MKAKGCVGLGCVGALGTSIMAILALAAIGTWLEPSGTPAPDASAVEMPQGFARSDDAAGFGLSFSFRDHAMRGYQVKCRVARADLERELESFGFQEDEVWGLLNTRTRELLEAEVRRRDLAPYFRVETHGRGGYSWQWRVEAGIPEPEHGRAVRAARELGSWIENSFSQQQRAVKAALVAPYGFSVAPDGGLVIDYARLVESGTGTLADCHRALVQAGADLNGRQRLSQLQAFFQELEYEVPPLREDGRYTLGLWVPTEVMVRGRGDCDSKSVALSSVLRRSGQRVLFIVLPKHALIGVEMRPGPGDNYVRLGNRYFVLADPAGPARIPPGGQAISGSYQYVLIEPLANRVLSTDFPVVPGGGRFAGPLL